MLGEIAVDLRLDDRARLIREDELLHRMKFAPFILLYLKKIYLDLKLMVMIPWKQQKVKGGVRDAADRL